MEYIGIDLHKKSFTACLMDSVGKVLHRDKYDNSGESIVQLLSLCEEKPSVVIEATPNWMWMVKVLRDMDILITMAHPLRTKAIASARIKTDELDAETLAHLLRSNLVPTSYIPTIEEQEDRELARTRCQLVKQQTWIKNQIHAVLSKENIHPPVTDLFGKKGREWIDEQDLPENKRLIVSEMLGLLDDTKKRISTLEKRIKEKSKDDRNVQILESIPGIGTITAFILASEIGDPRRFPTGKKMAAYLGLVPSIYQSGKTRRTGSITKLGNPYARWVLVQAAHRLVRADINTKLAYQALSARRGKKRAIIAVARKLTVLCWRLLVDDRKYEIRQPKRE